MFCCDHLLHRGHLAAIYFFLAFCVFCEVIAMAGEPRKLSSFTGDFGGLVAAVLPHLDLFVRPLALECKRSRMLFVCSVPDNTVGGICDRKGHVVMEKLCVQLAQDLLTPQEFWWFFVGRYSISVSHLISREMYSIACLGRPLEPEI